MNQDNNTNTKMDWEMLVASLLLSLVVFSALYVLDAYMRISFLKDSILSQHIRVENLKKDLTNAQDNGYSLLEKEKIDEIQFSLTTANDQYIQQVEDYKSYLSKFPISLLIFEK